MPINAISQSQFFTLCEDVKSHPDLYKRLSPDERVKRARAVVGTDRVSLNAVLRAGKTTGVEVTDTRRGVGPVHAGILRDHESRLRSIEEALGLRGPEEQKDFDFSEEKGT